MNCIKKVYAKAKLKLNMGEDIAVYIHTAIIVSTGLIYIWASLSSIVNLICSVLFTIILVGTSCIKISVTKKYIYASLAFILFFVSSLWRPVDYFSLIKFSFYIPLIYAYLLPDPFTTIVTGILIGYIYSTYAKVIPIKFIIGNIFGIVYIAIAFSTIFFLIYRLREGRNKYYKLSITDSLTKLYTLSYCIESVEKNFKRGSTITVFIVDLDKFKQVNDTYGHFIGNKVLIQFAEILKRHMAGTDSIIGRLGGDEFIIFLKGYTKNSLEEFKKIFCDKLSSIVVEADSEFPPIKMNASIGIASASKKEIGDLELLIQNADKNMYYNKFNQYNIPISTEIPKVDIPERCQQLIDQIAEKDMYTYVHSQYTAQYAATLAQALGLSKSKIDDLYIAGWVHDLGKLYISSTILRKPIKLTSEEYEIIKHHVLDGVNIIGMLNLSNTIRNAVMYHHERYDGKGYPFKLNGQEVPMEGRIMQVADVFSALTVKRVYRKCLSIEEAIEELKNSSGTQLDPALVEVFVNIFKKYKSAYACGG